MPCLSGVLYMASYAPYWSYSNRLFKIFRINILTCPCGRNYIYKYFLMTCCSHIKMINLASHKLMIMLVAMVAMATVVGIPAYADIPEEVKVGSLLPLTGGYSSVGVWVDAATELAVDDFNAYLEEIGADWQFVLIREDSASNPLVSLEKIQTLHADGADIVFGPGGSERVTHVKGYVDSNNMIALSCCSTAPSLSIPNDRIFRTVADDTNQGKALGKLLEHRGIEAIVTIHIGDAYGDGLINATVTDFMSRGGVVSDNGIRYNPDASEYSVSVGTLADEVQKYADEYGADKVGVVVVAFAEIVSILQTVDNYTILKDVRWFGSETVNDEASEIADDRIAREVANDIELTPLQLHLDTSEKSKDIRERLVDKMGGSPVSFAYSGYDAVWLVGLSILEADSADPTDIVAVLPDVAANYADGALSSTNLNANGDLATIDYKIWTINGEEWISNETYYTSTDTIAGPVSGDVHVGSLLPLTGGYSSVGVQMNAATVLAVEHFNKYLAAKDAGWALALFQEDTASNPVTALEKAQVLHSREADILFGPAGSSRVKHVTSYVNDNNMVLLSCCSTSTELAVANDRVFRVVADDANQGKAFGILLAHEGIEVAVPLWIGDSYGDSLRNAALSEFEARGGMSDEGIRYNPDVREFSVSVDALARVVQEHVDSHGADKVAIVVVAFDEIVSILQSADRYPVLKDVRWYGSETLAQNPFIVKDRIARDFATDVEFSAIQVPLGDGPRAKVVTDTLSVSFSGTPNAFAYNAYDAVWLAGLSIERTGSTDPADIAAILPILAASYTSGALSSTQLNEAGDLALATYGTWRLGPSDWYVDSVIHINDESIVPFE